ncbi:Lipocalin Precursor [Collichthys lucidus]|uniref:Lipocalin n=1 Tax=Collichthys lucidus TaxID=240159 RepID=A0A4U5VL39_COLLU|nr:Lipocalin Precursor [Collichthys lucidus]
MRSTLLGMLAAVICTLAVCADVTPVQDFDLEKMSGKWYLVGLATNAPWFVENKEGMKMGTVNVSSTPEGDLDLSHASLNADGTCWRMTHLAKKSDTPGRFVYHSLIWNNDNDMRIVDVVYDDYALVHTTKTKEGVSEVALLRSRSPLQQKFRQFSLETGILADNIVIFPQNGECPEA